MVLTQFWDLGGGREEGDHEEMGNWSWGMRSCERCCQMCMAWLGGMVWKKTGRDDVSTYKVALIAVSNRRVG